MNTDEQYVPSEDYMRRQYVVKRMHDGATRTHAEQECTRWLAAHDARVRRDAAREALIGAEQYIRANMDEPYGDRAATRVADYARTHYPEETP